MVNRYFYFNIFRKSYIFSCQQIKKILRLPDSPHKVALGVGIGLFIAFTPTIPFQMILSFLLAFIFKANKTAAVVPAWVTNPVTAPPIYYLEYITGALLLSEDIITLTKFNDEYVKPALAFPLFDLGAFWDQAKVLIVKSLDQIAVPMVIGSLLWSILIGVIFYFVTLRALSNRIEKKKQKKLNNAKQTVNNKIV